MTRPSHFILGCILMVTSLFTSASAQTLSIPTSVRNLNEDLVAEFRPSELGKADRSILQITIGVHTLADVLRILGPSQVMRSSEGCSEVCYISSIPGDGTRLIFSFDPLEGSRREGSRRAIYFQVLDDSTAVDLPCAHSRRVSKVIGTPSGLRLGASIKSLHFRLGRPTSTEEQAFTLSFRAEQRMAPEQIIRSRNLHGESVMEHPFFEWLSGVRVTYHDHQITSFEVYRYLSR